MTGRSLSFLLLGALVAAMAGLWGSDYTRFVLLALCLNLVMACSYNLFSGYGGLISLGHGLFFGLGGYTCAILAVAGYPRTVCILAGGFAAAAGAALLGPLALSLRRVSFSIVTLGIVIIFEQLAKNLESFTGGSAGLSVFPALGANAAVLLMGALALAAALGNMILKSTKMGYGLLALREHEQTAELSGCDAFGLRYAAFILSAPAAGLAGGLSVLNMAYVSPSSALGLEQTLAPVVMVMVGGPGTAWGPVVGAVALTLWREALWTTVDRFPLALYGATLLAVGLFLPGGLIGLFSPGALFRFRWLAFRKDRMSEHRGEKNRTIV